MTITRKRANGKKPRAAQKTARVELDTQEILKRVEEMLRELEMIRMQLVRKIAPPPANLVDQLFGALGYGTWDEYDKDLDWKRFSEWQTR